MPSSQGPNIKTLTATAPALATATSGSVAVGRNKQAIYPKNAVDTQTHSATVVGARYTPTAAIAGVNTNTRLIQVFRRRGASAAVLVATLQFNAGVNADAFAEVVLTLQAAANLQLNPEDSLEFRSTAVGTGLADPGGLIEVDVSRE